MLREAAGNSRRVPSQQRSGPDETDQLETPGEDLWRNWSDGRSRYACDAYSVSIRLAADEGLRGVAEDHQRTAGWPRRNGGLRYLGQCYPEHQNSTRWK